MSGLDYRLFAALNGQAGRWPWLDATARLFLNDYFVATLLALLLLALWFEGAGPATRRLNQRAVLVATLGTILGNSLLKIINLLYHRPRPFVSHEVNLLFYQPTDSSLPSNAALIGFAIAGGVWLHNRQWGAIAIIIATLFAVSRVFGGVHYPLDILTGAALGWCSAWFVHRQRHLVDKFLGWIIILAEKLSLP